MPSKRYNREINFKGRLFEEQYQWTRDDFEGIEILSIRLTDHLGNVLHSKRSKFFPEKNNWETLSNTLPTDYRYPGLSRIDEFCDAFMKARGEMIPLNPNGVAFGVKDSLGRLVTDKRTHFNETGDAISDPGQTALTGGGIEPGEVAVAITLHREFKEEFGVELEFTDYVYLGAIYDPYMGRMVDVFHITTDLDELFERQFKNDVKGLIDVLKNFESQGMLRWYKEDLDEEIAKNNVNSITMQLLELFNEFQPASKITEERWTEKALTGVEDLLLQPYI